MAVFIRGQETYNVDGLRIPVASPAYHSPVDPTVLDKAAYIGQSWVNDVTEILFVYFGNDTNGDAIWIAVAQSAGDLLTLEGNSGGPISPVLGNINVVGDTTTGITVTGAGNTLTITASGSSVDTAQTVGATTADLFSVPILNNRAIVATCEVAGARADYSASYGATGAAGYNRAGGAVSVLPNVVINGTITDGLASTIGASFVISGTNAILRVTGEAGQTWNWSGRITVTIVSA